MKMVTVINFDFKAMSEFIFFFFQFVSTCILIKTNNWIKLVIKEKIENEVL